LTVYLGFATQVLAFDLEWKRNADMLTGRRWLAAAALNGKIYAIGGSGGENVVEEFDPSVGLNGTWTTNAPMPTGQGV
ncbi:MAG: kelch repeat-containing protein, partial [bacterium]